VVRQVVTDGSSSLDQLVELRLVIESVTCPRERCLMPSWGHAVYHHGGTAWQKIANRTVLYWSGMTETEHNGPYKRRTTITI